MFPIDGLIDNKSVLVYFAPNITGKNITWANADHDVRRHMAYLGHNKFIIQQYMCVRTLIYTQYILVYFILVYSDCTGVYQFILNSFQISCCSSL